MHRVLTNYPFLMVHAANCLCKRKRSGSFFQASSDPEKYPQLLCFVGPVLLLTREDKDNEFQEFRLMGYKINTV